MVSAVFALKLPVNSAIPSSLRLGDLTNIHAVAFRTDNRHARNEPSDDIFPLLMTCIRMVSKVVLLQESEPTLDRITGKIVELKGTDNFPLVAECLVKLYLL